MYPRLKLGIRSFQFVRAQDGNFSEIFASGKEASLDRLVHLYLKNKQTKSTIKSAGFFLVALFWLPVSPFKFHSSLSLIFILCKISILCALIQILYGITQA